MSHNKPKNNYNFPIKFFVRSGDLVVINLFFILFYKISSNLTDTDFSYHNIELAETFLLINLIYFIASSIVENRIWHNIIFFDKVVQQSVSFISLYFLLFTVGVVLLHSVEFKWTNWVFAFIGLLFTYTVWHITLRIILKLYRRQGYNHKNIVIIGGGKTAIGVYNELKSSEYGYNVLGIFENKTDTTDLNAIPILGNIQQIEKYCTENKVDEVYCTLPNSEETTIVRLINFAERNMIRFYLVPQFHDYIRRQMTLSALQSIPVMTIRFEPLQVLSNRIIKRCFDILFSSIVCITILPLACIVFGILIKLTSKGPVLFKQKRTGLEGKEFVCYKFRTMDLNDIADETTAVNNDPRITKIGAFMRKRSIDELPQFFNVLTGNMSVVGPRPHMLKQTELYNQLIDKFMIRHLIKPGITGWAQISGYRGETKTVEQMEGRFRRDVWYLENWSFVLDLKIIFVTIVQLIKGDEKAY